MARLAKARLFDMVEPGIREGSFSLLRLSEPAQHPARYLIFRGEQSTTARLYIWNLTPGGEHRPADEWRIQATGVASFGPEADGETLILGWDDARGLFVGFDFAKHQAPLGHSPSIQLREQALDDAVVHGLGIHNKGNGEVAVAFRPDLPATYIFNARQLHACGEVEGEIELLRNLREEALDNKLGGEPRPSPAASRW